MNPSHLLAPILLTISITALGSEETSGRHYASSSELKIELAERREDIRRTEARIAALNEKEIAAQQRLESAQFDGKQAAATAGKRARMFYRITRNGGAVRYILDADSVIDMLKRAALMKQLFIDGLEARREAGLRIAAAQQQLASVRTEKEAAYTMHAMLTAALTELTSTAESE